MSVGKKYMTLGTWS